MKPEVYATYGASRLHEGVLPDGVGYGMYHVPYEAEFQKDMVVMHMDWSGLSWELICVQTVKSLTAEGIFDVRFPNMTVKGEAYILVESPMYYGQSEMHRRQALAKHGEPVKVRRGEGLWSILMRAGYTPQKHGYSQWYMLATDRLEMDSGDLMWTEMARIARKHTERCTKALLQSARMRIAANIPLRDRDWEYCGSDDPRYL